MEVSQVFESCQHAVASPSGKYVASLTQQHLHVQHAVSLASVHTFPLDADTPKANTFTIHWSSKSSRILLLHPEVVLVFSLQDSTSKVRITNGSGGLGKIALAELLGEGEREQVMVVWEFGRVTLWDLATGKATEIGDAKTPRSWTVRRQAGKTEVLAIISRTAAQDVLSLYLPPSTTPLTTATLPTLDAQSLTWSPSGHWLAILDTPLTTPSLHVYTASGQPFRAHPHPTHAVPDDLATGPRALAWSDPALALASNDHVDLLTTRTFTPTTTFSTALAPLSGWQEQVDARGGRSYKYVSGALAMPVAAPTASTTTTTKSTPASASTPAIANPTVSFNPPATHLGHLSPSHPTSVSIYALHGGGGGGGGSGGAPSRTILLTHSAVRRALWHPSRAGTLLVLADDGGVAVWDVSGEDAAPVVVEHGLAGPVDARWICPPTTTAATTAAEGEAEPEPEQKLGLLITSRRRGWCIVWPEGRPAVLDEAPSDLHEGRATPIPGPGADGDDDSLYDILTGRTPLPALGGRGRDLEEETGRLDESERLEDTFREKRGIAEEEDSEIF